ncbi:MAG: hypothetical protein ACLP1X_30015 [Polyangiaceae bacterium]
MREAAAFVLLACACGMAAKAKPADAPAPPSPTATDAPNRFESIVRLGPSIAPGMRLVARRESAGDKIELVRADEGDTCVRVAFEAAAPIVAKLVDGTDKIIATSGAAAAEGLLGERGPVCIRKGEVLNVTVDGPNSPVRWVAWAAP